MTRALVVGSVLVAAVACGTPSPGGSTSETADGDTTRGDSGSTSSATAASVGTTAASEGTTTATEATTAASESTASTTEATGTTEDTAGACSPEPPVEVPAPPPGCEHYFLHDGNGDPDPARPSGLWTCDGDPEGIYRPVAVPCACERFAQLCPTGDVTDCGPNGACGAGESCISLDGAYCFCQAQCNADSECADDQACLCAVGIPLDDGQELFEDLNRCVPADCREDADCGGSLRCRVSLDICANAESFHCSTPTDACTDDGDCPEGYCRWNEAEARWTCDQLVPCE